MKKYRTAKAFRVLLTTSTALIALAAAPALADADAAATSSSDKDNSGLQNIIITANKRAENIQTVPTAVTAISAEQLKDLGITNATDIAQFTPGVQVMSVNAGTTNFFSIRGATEDDYAEHEESPVAMYIDGVYQGVAGATAGLLFDTERVEVLRGPQGTLFGRNATAGAVQYISKGPTDTPDGYFETSYGNYNANHTEGAFGDGITNDLSFRISLANDYMDPWEHNVGAWVLPGTSGINTNIRDGVGDYWKNYDGRYDAGNHNSHAGRLQFLYKPSDQWDATLNLHASNQDVRSGLYKYHNTGSNEYGLATLASNQLPNAIGYTQPASYGYYTSAADVLGHNKTDTVGVSGTVHWHINDDLTLTSISDVSHFTKNYSEDSESSPYPATQFWTGVNYQQYSQEVHLENGSENRLRWVAGLYFLQMDGRYEQGNGAASSTNIPNAGPDGYGMNDVYWGTTPQDATCVLYGSCEGVDQRYTINSRSWSEFAQTEYDILKDLTLTVGGRWATDTRELFYTSWGSTSPYAGGAYAGAIQSLSPGSSYDATGGTIAGIPKIMKSDWSGKAALDYKVTDDVMTYVSWTRGIKPGGFSVPNNTTVFENGLYKYGEEKVYDVEGGVKAEFFDHRLRVNADVFYYDYVGYQSFNTISSVNGQPILPTSYIANNSGKMRGGELDVLVRPIAGLTIHQGLAILDADLDNVASGTNPDGSTRFTDVKPVQAPRANYIGSIDYNYALPESIGSVLFGVDYSWRSSYFYELDNDPASRQGAYWLVNLRAEYTTEDGQWSVKGYGSNITGTQYLTNSITAPNGQFYQGVWGMPATFGVRFSYHL
jgi:iron complex outermembrane receptor protein